MSFKYPFLCGRGLFSSNMPRRFNFFLANCLYHYIMRRFPAPPNPRQKKGLNHYKRMVKKLQLTVSLRTGGSPLVAYPGHNNSTRATQTNLQMTYVTVTNVRCLSSLLSPLKKHVWLDPNIFGLFYKISMQGCKKSLAKEWLKVIFSPIDVCPTG